MANGSRLSCPTLPAAAVVVSLPMIAPRNTPCCQVKASVTSGITEGRRPPKSMALIGTPRRVFPLRGDHRALAGRRGEPRVGMRGLAPAVRRPGPPQPVDERCRLLVGHLLHQTSPFGAMAQLVKIECRPSVSIALAFDFMLVPGATPKNPASGLMACRRPSGRTSSRRCRRRSSRPSIPARSESASPDWSCHTPTGTHR